MKALFTLVLVFCLLTACEPNAPVDTDETENKQLNKAADNTPKMIKSAHYFSSAWPITFWQDFEEDDVAGELQQIKNDGFNTIVLVVPWRGFEVGFEQDKTDSVTFFYDRLNLMLASIVEQDLNYILRLGFPHFHMEGRFTYALEQCIGMYTDSKMQRQWRDYLHKIKQTTQPYQHASVGTLVSWEDFWCPHTIFPKRNADYRLEKAQAMQYGAWLKTQNQNMVKVFLQQNEVKFQTIPVPVPADLSYVLYLEFIDELFADNILKPAQAIFDDAAMEIRVDKLPVKQGEHYTWIGHDLYMEENNLRGTYWAPFWGAENRGELLTAEQALHNFHYFLKLVSDNGQNTNHVVEQFNFFDNTIHYPNHANIKPEELDEFLLAAQPLLKKYSKGYGVWAYRDYHDSAILNGSFEMGMSGWYVEGEASIEKNKQDENLKLNANSSITQRFLPDKRFKLLINYETVTLCLVASNQTQLTVKVADTIIADWLVESGESCTQLSAEPFKVLEPINFTLSTNTDVVIDEIKLYGFTQVLGLYDADGTPGKHLEGIRKINGM